MSGFDCLGAEGLAGKYITLRVRTIDADKLKKKLGGTAGAAAPLALTLVDLAPEAALKAALPFAVQKVRDDYGVTLEYQVSDAPPDPGEVPPDKFRRGVVAGMALAGIGYAVWHYGLSRLW